MNKELDNLIDRKIKATIKTDGLKCPTCRITQGMPRKGFKKFYCKHTTECVDIRIKLDSPSILE